MHLRLVLVAFTFIHPSITCVFGQVLAFSVACVGVSAFSSGIIEASKAEETMNILRSLAEESQQV